MVEWGLSKNSIWSCFGVAAATTNTNTALALLDSFKNELRQYGSYTCGV